MKKTLLLFGPLFWAFIVPQAQPSFLALTEQGGGYGSISKYDAANNTISLVHSFQINGAFPKGKLLKATNGLFYGMTSEGGVLNSGTIFSFDPSNSNFTVVKNFNNSDGANPNASLIQASNGKFYGMTVNGGTSGRGVIFSFDPITSQYVVLKNFDLTQGGHPWGSLIQSSDGNLYGVTMRGGTFNNGVLFSFDINVSNYVVLKNFSPVDGSSPFGSLMEASDGKLYGMTREGGTSGFGVIFSFDRSSANYTKVKNFQNTDGAYPVTSLIQASNGKLYGSTVAGGSSNTGVIFSFDITTSGYTLIKSLSYYDGLNPYSSLVETSNGKLYGMTWTGGTFNGGVIFSLDPITSSYSVVKNFDAVNGGNPQFTELQTNADGKLCGLTGKGGNDNRGVIFLFDPSTSTYNKLKDFGDDNAFSPQGTLCKASNGKYYGMTSQGGTSNVGVIFSFDRATSTYTVVKNFNSTDGANPSGSLIQASNGKLYGMTVNGGASDAGVIFSFDPFDASYTVLKNFTSLTGTNPFGSLLQASDGKLYGMTFQGGTSASPFNQGYGVIFSFDPATSIYSVLNNFDLNQGGKPYGSLIQASNGKLYGMTSQGGIVDPPVIIEGMPPPVDPLNLYGNGVIFSFDPSSAIYTVVKFFESNYGANPFGSLIQGNNGKLYGMTHRGGTSKSYADFGIGVLFSHDLATASYNVLKNFDFSSGAYPQGSLIQASDNKLYGMTSSGSSHGVIFSLDPVTSAFNKKEFNGANGANPRFSDLLEIKIEQLSCVANTTADAAEGSCSAIVSNIDPIISPAGSAVTHTLTGATTGNGSGTASGLAFNVGTTVVTYTATDDPSKMCSFTVTVNPTSVFYRDADSDDYGNAAETIYACTQPAGYVADNTDCNDNDASVHLAITYYRDADNDGFGDASSSSSLCQLTPPSGYVTNNSDCDDTQKLYQDADGDGYGNTVLVACGGVTNNTDCDDNIPAIHAPVTYYQDTDSDGYGNILNTTTACSATPPAGYVVNSTDCDDSNATTHPGATEICNNGIDDNCNGQADEGCPAGIPSISINDVSVYESNGVAVLTVSLSNAGVSDITIVYSTIDGTATSSAPRGKKGGDYVAASGNIIVPAGSVSATIRITINSDNVVESPENFTVKLSLNKPNAKKATISDDAGVVTILDGSGNKLSTSNKNITGPDQQLSIRALPNPSATYFTLVTQGNTNQPISLSVYDISGRLIETKYGLPANHSISIGHSYKPGLYNVVITQGSQKQTLKLVKSAQ